MNRLLHLHFQCVELAQVGEAALLLFLHQVLLFFRLLLPSRRGAQRRHVSEEVVKGVFQHPAHQAGRKEVVKEAAPKQAASAEEVLHHPLAVGVDPLGVAQLLRALAAKMLFFHMTVDITLVNKGHFILATIFAFHKSYLLHISVLLITM